MANDVELKVGADTREANKSLEQFRKDSTANLSAIEKAFGTLKTAAVTAVAAFSAKQVFDFLKGGVDAAIGAEVSFSKMAKALELSGNSVPGVAEAFDQLSNNIERVTGISAEAVQEQIGIAQAFNLTNEETQKLIIAATELSAATGESLATSVKNLGETFSGTTGRLKKAVPELASISEKGLKAGEAIDYVLTRFRGSAAKNLETFAGAAEQVGIAFGKIPEIFGEVIVGNEALRKGLQTVSDTFFKLVDILGQNKGAINTLITAAMDPLMGAFSLVTRSLGLFINNLNVGKLAVQSIGSLFADLNVKIREFDLAISKVTFGGRQVESATKALEAAKAGQEEYAKALQQTRAQIVKDRKQFDELIDSIHNYKDGVSAASKAIDQLAIANSKNKKARQADAKELEALGKAYETLYRKVVSESLNARDKEVEAYKDNLRELKRLDAEGVLGKEKINKLKEAIEKTHQKNLTEIAIKEAEDRKKQIATILEESNFTALVKLALAKDTDADLKKEVKTKLGTVVADVGATVVSSVAQGEKGFTQLVTNLVKAIPIFGNLIAAAVELGTLTPEENEKAIKGFAEGITKSMDNFNTNLGRLPDILSEVAGPLIEKLLGPLFANFISNLMKSLSAWPKLVPVIAKGVAQGLRAMGGIMSDAVKKAIKDTGMEGLRFYASAQNFFGTFANQVKIALGAVFASNPLLDELRTMKQGMNQLNGLIQFFVNMFQAIPGILMQIRDLFSGIGEQIGGFFSNLGSKISDGFGQLGQAIKNLFEGIIGAIRELPNQIKTAFGSFYQGMKRALSEVFSSFFQTFNNLAEKLKGFTGGGQISSSGGGGNILESLIPGRAKGLTEVPPGYPNDSYFTRLQSGERVVDSNTNGDLKEFLALFKKGMAGGSSKPGQATSQNVVIELKLDKRVLSREIFKLNFANERLA